MNESFKAMRKHLILAFLFVTLIVGISIGQVQSAGGSTIGNWSSTSSWLLGVVPTAGQNVQIQDGDILSFDAGATNVTLGTLDIGVGSIVQVVTGKTLAASIVTVSNNGILRTSGTGVFNASGSISIGSSGSLSILGGGSITAASVAASSATVSAAAAGTYTVTGLISAGTFNTNTAATITCGSLTVGAGTSSGALTVNNGNLTVTGSILFNSQNVNVTNGNLVINSGGYFTNSGNTVTLGATTGGILDITGGAGISSGSVFNCKSISLKNGSNSSFGGSINVNNGNWTNTGTVTLAFGGNVTNLGSLTTSSSTTITFGSSSASITAASIDLSAGGSLNFSNFGATVTLSGNVTCKDQTSISSIGTSKFIFNGTSTIDGGSTGSGAQFYDIQVNTGSSAQIANTVNLSGTLSLVGTGTFDADGSGNTAVFKLLSSSGVANQGSRIATLGTPANFTGKVTIERYIPNDLFYQYLAFPVTDLTIGNLQSPGGFPVTGLFASGGSSRGDGGDPLASSMYFWDATNQVYANYDIGGPSSLATSAITLSNTTGYAAWSYGATNKKIVMTGKTIATGNIGIPLKTGFNLIPNPYPSAIDFNSFKNRVGSIGVVYLQIDGGGAGNTYASSDGTACANCTGQGSFNNSSWLGEIALGQAFWVSSNANTTLTLTEADKTSTASTFSGKTEPLQNYMRIALKSGSMQDETLIMFDAKGSKDFNGKQDAIKHLNGAKIGEFGQDYINLSTFKGDAKKPLVFNYMPLLGCSTGSSSTSLNVADILPGNHSFKFSELETFTLGYKITLLDKFLATQTSISNGFEYKFTTTDNALSYGSGRFELKFEAKPMDIPTIKIAGTKLSSSYTANNQWYRDGNLIQGATGQTFEVTQSGSYSVKTTSNSCSAESLPAVLTITGIESPIEGISLYPNPTSDVIKLSLSKEIVLSLSGISLLDARGGTLQNIPVPSSSDDSEIQINLNDQPVGLYIVKLLSNNKVRSLKIIKK